MKTLLISVKSQISRGGIAVWTDRFLEKCESYQIECDLVNTETVGKRREQSTVRLNLLDEAKRTRRIFNDLNRYLKSEEKYEAIHLNTSCGTFGLFRDYVCAKRIKKKGFRLITHFHCDIPYWIGNPISKRFLGELVKLSNECLVLCENSRKYLEDNFAASSTKIPNFIDESMITEKSKTISNELRTAIFVGRVEEAKGARELFELAKRFSKLEFRLVGEVSDVVATWDKPDNVTLLGCMPHENVIAEMDKADIFIFPSHSEGFSLALTEAMARGLPCIATDVGANADMLEVGCGIITDIGDVDAMGDALHSLQNAEKRRRMSQNAIEKVKKEYSANVILGKFKEIYHS